MKLYSIFKVTVQIHFTVCKVPPTVIIGNILYLIFINLSCQIPTVAYSKFIELLSVGSIFISNYQPNSSRVRTINS